MTTKHRSSCSAPPETGALVLIDIDHDSQVAVVTLNRPAARNALNGPLLEALDAAWETVLDVDHIGCVVLTGAGPAFCAGMDLTVMAGGAADADITKASPLAVTSTPVIGAVNGPAVTGGLELLLPCDFLIASEKAWFADTHAKLGFLPGPDLSVGLAAAVGPAAAAEMSLTGRRVDAAEAVRLGLVNRVVPHDSLLATAVELARQVAGCDRPTTRQMKATNRRNFELVQAPAIANARGAYLAFVDQLQRSAMTVAGSPHSVAAEHVVPVNA